MRRVNHCAASLDFVPSLLPAIHRITHSALMLDNVAAYASATYRTVGTRLHVQSPHAFVTQPPTVSLAFRLEPVPPRELQHLIPLYYLPIGPFPQ